MNADGSGREVYTRGVRNSVGHDFNPATGELWWTDNQVDGMGDDILPSELNRQTEAGQHFGFPWTNARIEIPEYKDVPRPDGGNICRASARAAWYGAHEALAALPEGVAVEDALRACVSCRGRRQHEIMSEVAATLSDP